MSKARETAVPGVAASMQEVSAGGDIRVTSNHHYYGGSGPVGRVQFSPLAGVTVGVSGLIPQKPQHFVEREQVDDVEGGLAADRSAVVVTGMRGAGKTHVAAAYARRVLDRREGLVGWVNAETPETLYTGLAAIADRLGVAAADGDTIESARLLRDYLGSTQDRHLLVFDNAEHVDLVRELLPVHGGTRVVITTTNQAMLGLAAVTVDAGTGYTPDQAYRYLREATGITDDPDGEKELAAELGYLPLALAAAATAIAPPYGPRLSYRTYLQQLRAQPLPQALQRREGQQYPWRVDQAILLAIHAAEAPTGNSDLDEVVGWVLGLFAVLAPSGVDRSLLVHPDPKCNEFVDAAITHCVQRSLLSWSTTSETLLAHRLTSRVLLERARDHGTTDSLLTHALELIEPRLFDNSEAWTRRVEGAHLVDQIDAIHRADLVDFTTPAPRRGWLRRRRQPLSLVIRFLNVLVWATRQLVTAVDVQRAIPLTQHLLNHFERLLGPHHPLTLTARNNLARAYDSAGQTDEAIPLHEQNLADRERVHGPHHPDTLTARNNLAHAYDSAGRTEEAISLYEQTLADREQVHGPHHPNTLISRNNLAHAYNSAGRTEEAISLYEQTLADREQVLGPHHPDTLISRNNLASAYDSAGRTDEAIALHEQTLADSERVLGPHHPNTLISRNNLAHAYDSAGRTEEAISLYEQTLADRERVLGPHHPDTLNSRNNLAHIYRAVGLTDEAISLYEQILADRERILGLDHPRTVVARDHLASLRGSDDGVPSDGSDQ
ncbi:tetratricopeptide repeat protein [Nocardia sp. NPDC019255]|uniref:tetratricopeptide repeat protein n=1 Tax=Nocardia sp. NPDC019255 TaxID=3154591 RepID=UPI0033D21114